MKQDDFCFEDDYVYMCECEECHYAEETDDEMDGCPECGGNMLIQTMHEGLNCAKCGRTFDMWEDGYRSDTSGDLICEDCYWRLEEEGE